MAEPLVVSIPHRLGRDEAMRRLKSGLDGVRPQLAMVLTLDEARWDESRLTFRASALGQTASGLIDVYDDHVVLTVQLPWLLEIFRKPATQVIRQQGTLMLEKKK